MEGVKLGKSVLDHKQRQNETERSSFKTIQFCIYISRKDVSEWKEALYTSDTSMYY